MSVGPDPDADLATAIDEALSEAEDSSDVLAELEAALREWDHFHDPARAIEHVREAVRMLQSNADLAAAEA